MKKYINKIIFLVMFFICIFTVNVYAKDITITIDPGHGGIDVGSSNKKAGIIERDVNLKISRYLKQYLEEYANVKVVMTHNGFSSGKLDLIDRALVARSNNADLLISVHCNASDTSKSVNGAEAFVTANKSLPKYNQECSKLANLILDNISKIGIRKIGVKTRLSSQSDEVYSDGTRGDYYGIIRYAMKGIVEGPGANIQNGEGIPAVLVEHCYIQNGDEKYINNENGIKKLARADCDAIVKYYGLKLKSKVVSGISLNTSSYILALNDSYSLNATIYPSTAEDKKIIWSSNNESVAIVNNGKVTGISEGEAVITAKTNDGGFVASCKITVKDLSIDFESEKINVLKDEETQLIYSVLPYLPNGFKVKFNVEDEEIAEMISNDVVKAKNVGNTNIIVQFINTKNEVISEKNIPLIVNKLDDGEFINIENYIVKNSVLSRINPQTLKTDFIKNIKISDGLEAIIDEDKDTIATGTKVVIQRKKDELSEETDEIIKQYICLIYGDVNGDGQITPADYVKIKNNIMKVSYLAGIQYKAADVDKNNSITPADYVRVKNHIMKVRKIEQ